MGSNIGVFDSFFINSKISLIKSNKREIHLKLSAKDSPSFEINVFTYSSIL